MRYYVAKDIDKHFLFAKEIAELVFAKFGVASLAGRPHAKMIKALLDADIDDVKGEHLFYLTRNGMREVYPNAVIALRKNWSGYIHKNGIYSIRIAGKWWKYRIVEGGKNDDR